MAQRIIVNRFSDPPPLGALCVLGCGLCGEEIHRGHAGTLSDAEVMDLDVAWNAHMESRHPIRVWLHRRTRGFLGIKDYPA